MIKAVERQTNRIYTKDEKVIDRALRIVYFEDLEEDRGGVRAGKPVVPGGHRRVSAGQVANVGVLLRLP